MADDSSSLSSPSEASAAAALSSLQELIDRDWELQLSDNPCFASQSGNHAYDSQLQDLSPEAFAARLEHNRELLVALAEAAEAGANENRAESAVGDALDAQAVALSAVAPTGGAGGTSGQRRNLASECALSAADLAMLRQSIADETRGLELGSHLFPVNSIGYGGVHYNFIEALDWLGGDDDDDEDDDDNNNRVGDDGGAAPSKHDSNLVARMEAFPTQCGQYKELLREGIRRGRVASQAMLRKVPEQLRAAAQPAPLVKLVGAIRDEELKARGQEALAKFGEAIHDLVRFFEEEYAPHAREVPGCSGLPDDVGPELYALCLRFHTTT